ncbi:YicC/YloC family endoribonuclease [Fervidibacillus halotolerans]|uniref:YicC family protein n=1 Tax=Fervidibacillus halotolerans TaxID=2980027 RepID=A0A9E8M1C6_9BACI|nr:YicC/YloC family endoribonuclease [Fervidibacillus halotolerans]WAA13660.1 YicC family protein [Fervidibacillus halotolerans]
MGDKMAVSMTGFGRSKLETESFSITVEIRSVNHRFLDCYFRMPQFLLKFEDKLKKIVQKHLSRGRIDCFISISGENVVDRRLHIDWNLLDEYYQYIKELKNRYHLEGNITINHLIRNESFVSVIEGDLERDEWQNLLLNTFEEAILNLKAMRISEGKRLEKGFMELMLELENMVKQMEDLIPFVKKEFEEKLYKKLMDVTNGEFDESRILTEIAMFVERTDITEEITRLSSHLKEFHDTVKKSEPVGRKLDFLIQEMNRETNTIGSKTNVLQISKLVVNMKTVLEKMREQVQNIE